MIYTKLTHNELINLIEENELTITQLIEHRNNMGLEKFNASKLREGLAQMERRRTGMNNALNLKYGK